MTLRYPATCERVRYHRRGSGAAGGDCHVVVGDLNALRPGDPIGTPPSGETRRGDAAEGAARQTIGRILDRGYVERFRQMHPRRRGFTYPSKAAWLRLD